MKIKIFNNRSEEVINEWLENKQIEIIEILQSESGSTWHINVTITILFKEI